MTSGYINFALSYVQNGASTAANGTVNDYGDHRVARLTVTTLSGVLHFTSVAVEYVTISGKVATHTRITGYGLWSSKDATGLLTSCECQYVIDLNATVKPYVGKVEVWSLDGKTLLYGSGSKWPAPSASNVLIAVLQATPYVP